MNATPLRDRVPYPLLCTLLGLAAGWLPMLLHGPIPEKFNVLYIQGSLAIWTFYVPRLSIGFWVGIAAWPQRWWLRGPLLGALAMLGPGMLALGMPRCGADCMARNIATGAGVGWLVGAIAYAITRRQNLRASGAR
jgi:hypothetical protein